MLPLMNFCITIFARVYAFIHTQSVIFSCLHIVLVLNVYSERHAAFESNKISHQYIQVISSADITTKFGLC